jgi:glycosyltransferase involved in cell wall biosynthesis
MRILRPVPLASRPTVTVVVPHYNYGQYLPDAVRSAVEQRGVDVDVIIVDDRSTDGSVEVARRLASEDPRVKLVEHAQNQRHIRTYNDGLSRATGTYVVLLSADDALAPDALTRAVALMEEHRNVGLVYGRVEWFDSEMPSFAPSRQWWQVWDGAEWIDRVARRGRNAIVNPEVVMRRSVYESIGGYDDKFPHAGDMYMWLQAAARADIAFVGGPRQAGYRDHGANMHSRDYGAILHDMSEVRDVYRRFFASDGAGLPGADAMRRRAMRAVAREALLRGAMLTAGGAPASTLRQFRSFAAETWPRVQRSSLWRWSSLADGPRAGVLAAGERLRWQLRFRRTNLLGL